MSSEHGHFIIPQKYYVATFIALLFLTVVTVAVAQVDLGSVMNLIVALIVAGVKASLVVAIFMGMRWEKGFNRVAFIGSLLFVLIFIGFVFADVAYRAETDPVEAITHSLDSPVQAPGSHGDHHGDTHKDDSHH